MRKECRPKNIRVINYDKVLSGLQSILDKYDIPTETGVVSDILVTCENVSGKNVHFGLTVTSSRRLAKLVLTP